MDIHTVVLDEGKCLANGYEPDKVWTKIVSMYAKRGMRNEGNTFIADFDFDYTNEALVTIDIAFCKWFFDCVNQWTCDSEEDGFIDLYSSHVNEKYWERRNK